MELINNDPPFAFSLRGWSLGNHVTCQKKKKEERDQREQQALGPRNTSATGRGNRADTAALGGPTPNPGAAYLIQPTNLHCRVRPF